MVLIYKYQILLKEKEIMKANNKIGKLEEVDYCDLVITSEGFEFRPWKEEDLEVYYELVKDKLLCAVGGWSYLNNIEEAKSNLEDMIKMKDSFAVEYEGKVIGGVRIRTYHEEKEFPKLDNFEGRLMEYITTKEHNDSKLFNKARSIIVYYFLTYDILDFVLYFSYLPFRNCLVVRAKSQMVYRCPQFKKFTGGKHTLILS